MDTPFNVEAAMRVVHERIKLREGLFADVASPIVPEGRFVELKRLEAALNHGYRLFGDRLAVHRQGLRGKVEFFAKRVIRKLLRWYVRPQVEFNAAVARAVGECLRHLTVAASEAAGVRGEVRGLAGRGGAGPEAESEPCEVEYYHRFEERFRGPRALILERQRPYVTYFEGRTPVLDAGCGRGEFLELLHEAGVDGYGIDLNPEMVAHCRAAGLHAVQAEVFAHLEAVPDGSLGGVYLGQVVEHLAPPRISRLLKRVREKLQWGGVAVAETPNPVCEAAMRGFYIDPTHVRPVHPELLRFLAEEAGLDVGHFVFCSPLPGCEPASRRVDGSTEYEDVAGYRDYAAVLRRKY